MDLCTTFQSSFINRLIFVFRMSIVLSEFTQQFSHIFDNSVDYVKNLQSPRFIKSHLPFQLLPKEISKVKPKVTELNSNKVLITVFAVLLFLCINKLNRKLTTQNSDSTSSSLVITKCFIFDGIYIFGMNYG